MELAKNLQPVAGLIGVWEGEGRGVYPTIQDFTYREELTFSDIGKPFLQYAQRTWAPDGRLMHVETGYLRITPEHAVEFVLAIPTGQSELAEGTLETGETVRILLAGSIQNSSTAKQVDGTTRSYILDGDTLTTSFQMAAVGQSMAPHLDSVLHRRA